MHSETPVIQSHDFAPGLPLRSITRAGQAWFIAKDICDALGLTNRTRALAGLDEDEKGITTVNTLGGNQQALMVNESGLYALVLGSRKPAAKAFRRWVTSTVLPAIRRDGGYVLGEELLNVSGLNLRALEQREVLLSAFKTLKRRSR